MQPRSDSSPPLSLLERPPKRVRLEANQEPPISAIDESSAGGVSHSNDTTVAAALPAQAADGRRSRGITACQTCRRRKTKCDNERPTCGYCASVGANCGYLDSDHVSTL